LSGLRFQAGRARIEGRSADGWVVDGRLYRPALLLTAEAALSIPGLTLDTLEAATIPGLSGAELLLLGSGPTLKRPARAFVEGLRARNIRIEPMDSAAAARTYNVLAAEERLVAALIL
jgi:uncharacterized protein